MKRMVTLIFLIISGIKLSAQVKSTSTVNQIWTAYFNQTRFSDRWGSWTDLHLRTKEDFATNFSTLILRVGLTYHAAENIRFTAGYGFVNHFPAENRRISQPEHRPWQQVQWINNYKKLRTSQFLRLEQRFRRKILNDDQLAEGYLFNYRLRYNFLVSAPLSRNAFAPGSLAFVLNDELHINFGKEIVNNYFDQNRFFAGFSLQTNKTDNIQLGYLHFFMQQPAGNRYRIINGIRLSYFQNLDLRK